jgi:dihydrofolate reductase
MKQDNHAVPECSVFVGVSLDGFIARPNGDLDWLMGDGGGDSAEYGYDEFIAGIDAIVMGRKTFEKVVMFDKWYYGNKRVVALSHHSLDLAGARARGGVVEQMQGSPAEIVSKLASSGAGRLYVDGGLTIQEFHTAFGHQPSPRAHRRRHSTLRLPRARYPSQSYRHTYLSRRHGPK